MQKEVVYYDAWFTPSGSLFYSRCVQIMSYYVLLSEQFLPLPHQYKLKNLTVQTSAIVALISYQSNVPDWMCFLSSISQLVCDRCKYPNSLIRIIKKFLSIYASYSSKGKKDDSWIRIFPLWRTRKNQPWILIYFLFLTKICLFSFHVLKRIFAALFDGGNPFHFRHLRTNISLPVLLLLLL